MLWKNTSLEWAPLFSVTRGAHLKIVFTGGAHLEITWKKSYNTTNLACSDIVLLKIVMFYNKGVKKKIKTLYSSVFITVLIDGLKRQVENILISFLYI